MGSPKPLLNLGGRTLLDALLEPLVASCVEGVAVVTRPDLAEQIGIIHRPGVFVALNDDDASEMIDSVRIGLQAWRERLTVADRDGFLVCPADHPGITTADFNACIAAFRGNPDRIIIATRGGVGGHPIIFPATAASVVQSPACDGGLHGLPRAHPDRVFRVECGSPGITRDVDTPEDLSELT